MKLRRLRSSMGSSPEPAVPAYRRLRMHRKRPQVLGGDLNCSESTPSAGLSAPFANADCILAHRLVPVCALGVCGRCERPTCKRVGIRHRGVCDHSRGRRIHGPTQLKRCYTHRGAAKRSAGRCEFSRDASVPILFSHPRHPASGGPDRAADQVLFYTTASAASSVAASDLRKLPSSRSMVTVLQPPRSLSRVLGSSARGKP
jgi:hypothetical protein